MIDLEALPKALENLLLKYGIGTVIVLIISQVILYYLINRLKNEAKVPTERYLAEIRNSLKEQTEKVLEKYKKEIQILFRDEEVRKSIISQTVVQSDLIRIETYKNLYAVFFDIIFGISNLKEKKDENERENIFNELSEELLEVRKTIFINSVQMGRLTDFLLKAQIALSNDLSQARTDIKYPWVQKQFRNELYDASEEISKAEKWLQENLKTRSTIKDFDFTDDLNSELKEKRNELIKRMFDTGDEE